MTKSAFAEEQAIAIVCPKEAGARIATIDGECAEGLRRNEA